MSSLVFDLQADALNPQVAIGDLLRKALVIARKLKIADFQKWIENEQNGYEHLEEVPTYRVIRGQIVAWNSVRGWLPVQFPDSNFEEKVTVRQCGQAISEIEHISKQDPSGWLGMPFAPEQEKILIQIMSPKPRQVSLQVQSAVLARILESVRNTILSWALRLEEDGILGTGVTFSQGEKEAAASHTYNVTNFHGPVVDSQIQQGTVRSSQTSKKRN